MSSLLLTPGQQKPSVVDWARLIPGDFPDFDEIGRKAHPPRRSGTKEKISEIARRVPESLLENAWTRLLPQPMRGRMAARWLRSMVADFALVAVNWLLIGALLVPLRMLFPQVRSFNYAAGAPISLLGIALLHASLITLMGYTEGLHATSYNLRMQAGVLGKSVFWATAILCCASALQGVSWTIILLLGGAGALHFGALWTWRRQTAWHNRRTQSNGEIRNVLIIGAGGVGRRVASHVERHPEAGRAVCGFLDNHRPLGKGVIGRVSELARIARTEFIDEVILAAPHDRSLIVDVVREAQRLRLDVEIVPELFGCTPTDTEFERVADLPVICLHAERLPSGALIVKRALDVVGSCAALVLLSPLLFLIGGLIKADSGGSVLYRAPRAGRKGRRFLCCKFRTMVSNADAMKDDLRGNNQRSGPFFKITDDPRITRVGRWLRRYSLDELPQLWNVFKGEMSLVGPRPHPLDDVAGYEIEHLARLDVTPGITGLWQVTARRDPSFQRGVELDREYIRTWSLGSDLRLLLKTVSAVVRGSGE